MISKLKGIVLVVILSLASIMMPFNVYADTISASNIVGVNIELLGSTILEHRVETVSPNQYNYYYKQYTYKAIIELDNSYVGVIGARVQGSYYNQTTSNGGTIRTESLNHYKKIYVNGNTAEMTFVVSSWYSSVDDPIIYRADGTSPYVTIEDSNVTKFEDIDSIEQIIDLLSDIYQNSNDIEGLSTNQLDELQNIVANTSLANQYLNVISQMKQWHMPIESYAIVSSAIMNNLELIGDSFGYQYFDYPVYKSSNGDILVGLYGSSSSEYTWIFYTTLNFTINNINQYFSFSSNVNIIEVNNINRMLIYYPSGNGGLFSVKFKPIASGHIDISYIHSVQGRYVPIYIGLSSASNISTDFALQFGLSNQLLDDIHIIAQGTNQSNSAASDLENEASEYSDIADDVIGVEEGLTSNFETSVNQIDLNTGLSGFGGNFMTSATWVRTQFDRLTENTPYGSLVVYGLTLGFVLLMLGKVLL